MSLLNKFNIFSSFLDKNIVIITILMPFYDYSSICDHYVLTSIGFFFFSFLEIVVFCFFACLFIFDWMLDIINFTFLGTGYFYIFIKILELCSGMQLMHLEQ